MPKARLAASVPAIDTVAASLAVPVMVVVALPTIVPDAGSRLLSDGGVLSIANVNVFCAFNPAQSVAVTASVCGPSAEIVVPELYAAPSSVAESVTFWLASLARTM